MKTGRKASMVARKHRSNSSSTSNRTTMVTTSGGHRHQSLLHQSSAARRPSVSAADVTGYGRHARGSEGDAVTFADGCSSALGGRVPDGSGLSLPMSDFEDGSEWRTSPGTGQPAGKRSDVMKPISGRTESKVDRIGFVVGNVNSIHTTTSIFDALVKLKATDGVRSNEAVPTSGSATGAARQLSLAVTATPGGRNGNQLLYGPPSSSSLPLGRQTLSWSRDFSSTDCVSCGTLVCARSSLKDEPLRRQTTSLEDNCCDVIQKTTEKAANTVLLTIFLAIFAAVPLAMACIGVKHLDDCPIQPNIPVYLFVGGCFGLLKVLSLLWRQVRSRRFNTMDDFIDDDDDNEQSGVHTGSSVTGRGVGGGILVSRSSRFSELVLSAFLVIWFVCGNCWVLSVSRPISFKQQVSSPSGWCDRTVYMFALIQIVASYVIGVTAIFLVVLITVCHKALSLFRA